MKLGTFMMPLNPPEKPRTACMDEELRDRRVELLFALGQEEVEGALVGPGLLVGPGGGEGVEDVHHRADAPQEGDLPAGQALERALNADARTSPNLPGRYYYDPAIFEAEAEAIFFKSWQFAGHRSQFQRASIAVRARS